jgi:hypothetical protein
MNPSILSYGKQVFDIRYQKAKSVHLQFKKHWLQSDTEVQLDFLHIS